ncbi:class I SAM-dependent methyltransferase [Candidatus Gracilibacteria bacterium]|nr:class I SAM-dependent methyltransferase [Candidatus Gracilibacteria bacterium]MCF7819540.1 class I SAM-dependent methyltransferase [Candidatus Gracilibacteria bacterium]
MLTHIHSLREAIKRKGKEVPPEENINENQEEDSRRLDAFRRIQENIREKLGLHRGFDPEKSLEILEEYTESVENRGKGAGEKIQSVLRGLKEKSLVQVIDDTKQSVNPSQFMAALFRMAQETKTSVDECLRKGEGMPMSLFTGRKIQDGEINPQFIEKWENWWHNTSLYQENSWKNWLQVAGVAVPDSYESIHKEQIYNLTTKEKPSQFAHQLVTFDSHIRDKEYPPIFQGNILELGAGNGRDSIFFLQEKGHEIEKIRVGDISSTALENVRQKSSEKLDEEAQKKFLIPEKPEDMFHTLKRLYEEGERMDLVYMLSSAHYFDTDKFKELIRMIRLVLKEDKYLAFSVKAPHTDFDGVGIPLDIRRYPINTGSEEGEHTFIHKHFYTNLDGHNRVWRSAERLKQLFEKRGFEIVSATQMGSYEENYEFDEQGKVDFLQFILQKKPLTSEQEKLILEGMKSGGGKLPPIQMQCVS